GTPGDLDLQLLTRTQAERGGQTAAHDPLERARGTARAGTVAAGLGGPPALDAPVGIQAAHPGRERRVGPRDLPLDPGAAQQHRAPTPGVRAAPRQARRDVLDRSEAEDVVLPEVLPDGRQTGRVQ